MIAVLDRAVDGGLDYDAADAYRAVGAEVFVWPRDQRPAEGKWVAKMHAKCAVADHHAALIGSANLSAAALRANMELGVLFAGGDIPRRLQAHFRQLMIDGVLRPLNG